MRPDETRDNRKCNHCADYRRRDVPPPASVPPRLSTAAQFEIADAGGGLARRLGGLTGGVGDACSTAPERQTAQEPFNRGPAPLVADVDQPAQLQEGDAEARDIDNSDRIVFPSYLSR